MSVRDSARFAREMINRWVSILVLVDVGPRSWCFILNVGYTIKVSILVLVDVGPRSCVQFHTAVGYYVSILVLVDVGPRSYMV